MKPTKNLPMSGHAECGAGALAVPSYFALSSFGRMSAFSKIGHTNIMDVDTFYVYVFARDFEEM